VGIGDTLARAREHAGLSVAEVSARTRIRETLISAIEHDDFGSCGGDFYVRGHIRAIATVLGIDSQALISEYDAAHPPASPMTLEDLPSPPQRRRRIPHWTWLGMVVLLGVIGMAAYQLAAGASGRPAPVAMRTVSTHHPSPAPPSPSPASSAAAPTPAPSPTATAVTQLTPVSAAAYGPSGTADGDNPQNASLALSGNPATPWHTSWYTTPQFGNLQSGTGLLVDLGHTFTITGAAIQLGNTSGADLQLRAGTSESSLATVASSSGAGGLLHIRLTAPVPARYLLIWFTLLPPDGAGTYQADISRVTVTALREKF
jgi:cytoskeletal protein RodZ